MAFRLVFVWYAYVFILRVRAISLREAIRAVDVTLVGETCENDGFMYACMCDLVIECDDMISHLLLYYYNDFLSFFCLFLFWQPGHATAPRVLEEHSMHPTFFQSGLIKLSILKAVAELHSASEALANTCDDLPLDSCLPSP